jgi:hypothetical protein
MIILNLFDTEIYLKGLLSAIVLLIYNLILRRLMPYGSFELNNLEYWCTTIVLFSIILALMGTSNSYEAAIWIVLVLLFVINIGFALVIIYKIISSISNKIRQSFNSFRFIIFKLIQYFICL